MSPTLGNASALLAAIDPLSLPERRRMVADTARALAGTPALTSVLAELGAGGVFERELALILAQITRSDDSDHFFAVALGDPDFGIRCRGLDVVVRWPRFDDAVMATFADAPAAWRAAVVRAVRKARRVELADRIVTAEPRVLPERLAARLLSACSEKVVAELLPQYTHLEVDWLRLGSAHPRVVLDVVGQRLDELPEGLRSAWWLRCANGVTAAVDAEPQRVLRLLERHPVWQRTAFPPALAKRLGALVALDPARTLRLLIDRPDASAMRMPRMSRTVRRRLLLGAPEESVRWGRLCLEETRHLLPLLRTLPPSRRTAYFDEVTAGQDLARAVLDDWILDVLPRERRHREARRMLTLPDVIAVPALQQRIMARLPWAEAHTELRAATRVADAGMRAAAYLSLVGCAAKESDPALFGRFLAEDLARLRNEQDPVRQSVLGLLARTSPSLFDATAVEPLTRIATDAVEVRDISIGSLSSLRMLARRLLVHHADSGNEELLAWCLTVMEQVEGTTGAVDQERLDRLRHGQERAVVDALTPWVRRGIERGDHRRALAVVRALGRRAHAMEDVQEWVADAVWKGTTGTAGTAIDLWLADPAHRDERVERLIAWDPTVAHLSLVASHLANRRTDLLDPYLVGDVIEGRFVATGTRWFPVFWIGDTVRWLPRQRESYARLLTLVAGDNGAKVWSRTDAIQRCARLGPVGEETVRRFLASNNVPLAEAALAALAWLPDPAGSIPALLEHTDGDRARVAVYAVTRAARFARPSEIEVQLRSVLESPTSKITSRKEALRIAALVGVPGLVELLLDTWKTEGQHRHVRAAAVTRLVDHLDDPRVWTALDTATTADRDIAAELLRTEPLDVPARHRAAYGRLVAALCAHQDPIVSAQALRQAAGWYRWTPEVVDAVVAAALDVEGKSPAPVEAVGRLVGAGWPVADYLRLLRRLVEMDGEAAEAEAAEPDVDEPDADASDAATREPAKPNIGESADPESDGTGPDDAESADAGPDSADPASAFHDRPARRRVEQLSNDLADSARLHLQDWRPVVEAAAGLLAAEPGWLRQAAQLTVDAVDLTAPPAEFSAGVGALVDLTDGRPLAARIATERLGNRVFQDEPLEPASFHAAASHLATDARTSAGIVAVALIGAAGPLSGWDAASREVVRTLRRHADPDVAELALRLNLESRWQQ